jgi:hypothetical protein
LTGVVKVNNVAGKCSLFSAAGPKCWQIPLPFPLGSEMTTVLSEKLAATAPVNLAPGLFVFWQPPAGFTVAVGAESHRVALPAFPLPIATDVCSGETPTTAQIGQGVYDYLRRFPDCEGNRLYAGVLRDAFPHFLSDLAAHVVMLDAKDVEPAYVLRKLTGLKILQLVEPANAGVLRQLCRGFFDLALDFSELANCRRHLLEAMRYGQELLCRQPEDPQALSLLAEIDVLFGDVPGAHAKFQRLRKVLEDDQVAAQVGVRLAALSTLEPGEKAVVDELEEVAAAMELHLCGDNRAATVLLERIEEQGRMLQLLPSADFYCLLAYCRQGCGDPEGATVALHRALELEPGHAAAVAALAGD